MKIKKFVEMDLIVCDICGTDVINGGYKCQLCDNTVCGSCVVNEYNHSEIKFPKSPLEMRVLCSACFSRDDILTILTNIHNYNEKLIIIHKQYINKWDRQNQKAKKYIDSIRK